MSAPTFEGVRETFSQKVYDKIMANIDVTKWSVITPITAGEQCDITSIKAAVFAFDLGAFETACATASDCVFDKTLYEPHAFGFLWQEGETKCEDVFGPYIMNKPDGTLPFEAIYWNHYFDICGTLEDVTYDSSTYYFGYSSYNECDPFQFLDGCFADLRAENDYYLFFSLLKSTEGLEDGSTQNFHVTWYHDEIATAEGAAQTITLGWDDLIPEEVEEEVVEPKWYESKTFKVTVGLGLSVSTIALLMLIP